jgi:uncharacterized protein with HEPN domain
MPLDVHDAALLHDMLHAAQLAIRYTINRSRGDFDADSMLADAVIRRIEIIGEAARSVSELFRSEHSEVAWRQIMATRHILAQDYDEVNHDTVWRIVKDHLPSLIAQLEGFLSKSPPPSDD